MSTLVHVDDQGPGITRVRKDSGFAYRRPDGSRLTGKDELARIRTLAIPPAWTDVWIAPRANAHLQATGRDARGRKQYRYHPEWTAVRDATKYARMLDFVNKLPALRRQLRSDLGARGLPRHKVVATVVQLLEASLIRVGNEEYARQNRSFGLTTILDRHATITSSTIRFKFRGKSGKMHDITLADPRLARIAKRCQDLPGSQLFQYLDEAGEVRDITSSDVNDYLRDAMGDEFTAKDFRTWAGTVLAARTLAAQEEAAESEAQRQRSVNAAIAIVADALGNTRAICRKCYIHPVVLEAHHNGTLAEALSGPATTRRRHLTGIEVAVMALIRNERGSSICA